MVNLSETQQARLGNVSHAKATFDTEWEAELRRHKLAEETLKRPVREAIMLADEAGVPQLRIAKSMGFNQVNQLVNWLRDKTQGSLLTAVAGTPQRPLAEVQEAETPKSEITINEMEPNLWRAYGGAENGAETIDFELYNYGGQQVAVAQTYEEVVDWPDWFSKALTAWNQSVLHGWPDD